MIVVVGAGFLGLSCALRLARAGRAVRVLSRDPLDRTTSAASPRPSNGPASYGTFA